MSESVSTEKRVVRKEYELTQAQFDAILAASQPVPYMVVGGREPSSPRENAHRAWQSLGKELGFDWETVQPSQRGKMFFTAVATNPTYLTPCPVCGSEDDCPHTPVRCQHQWQLIGAVSLEPSLADLMATTRECKLCGRVERPQMTWETVKA